MHHDEDVSVATLKKWLANVESAQIMWASIPNANANLGSWRDGGLHAEARLDLETPTCGTIACLGGWCAWWPEFRAQGVGATRGGSPFLHGTDDMWAGDYAAVAEQLFGDQALFDTKSYEEQDDEELSDDHDVVTQRQQHRYMQLAVLLDC